jgi:3-oxoacyl-[acyl-carrier-protein] synthase-3
MDSAGLLRFGVDLAGVTYKAFLTELDWEGDRVDRVICHQVGTPHRDASLEAMGLGPEQDFSTYAFLGNMGTVSLPLTAALAEERGFLRPGDSVGLLGIGSGLNCLMLGVNW